MDNFQKISTRAKLYLFLILVLENTLLAVGWLAVQRYIPGQWQQLSLLGVEVVLVLVSILVAFISARFLLSPLKLLWQTVLFYSPNVDAAPPNPDKLRFGRELVANLANQIYQLASSTKPPAASAPSALDFITNNLPLPVFAIDENGMTRYVNVAASKYLGLPGKEIVGKSIYDVLNMSFPSEDTLDSWLGEVRMSSAVAQTSWDHIKLNLSDGQSTHQFDMAAYYNKGNANKFETILVLFDRTDSYSRDEDQASFLALAVHELRSPLTMLRGYIEILEEEIDDKSNLEFTTDLQKMRASAQLLAEYTNNILNVSRVDSDQLSLRLKPEQWKPLVERIVENMRLRARVNGKKLEVKVAESLPAVGIDHVSISEVLTNLIDNAIKYSHKEQPITITSGLNQAGEIETTVTDFGVVIDPSVIGNLFQRFYRNHRSRSEATGTGLGLYLSRALVDAHGGNIWVRSSEKDGTSFSFTILPYDRVAAEAKTEGDATDNIVRVPHGWIKNHSLYRR